MQRPNNSVKNNNIVDLKTRVKSIQQMLAEKEKGTPRFNRAGKGIGTVGGKQKISLKKKKSHEGQALFTRDSFNLDRNSGVI